MLALVHILCCVVWALAQRPLYVENIHINEVLANSGESQEDWIELYNDGPQPVDMSQQLMTDNLQKPTAFTFPQGTTINAYSYYTINELNGGIQPFFGGTIGQTGSNQPFGLSSGGETLYVLDSSAFEISTMSFDGAYEGQTWGRWTLSNGKSRDVLLSRATKGGPNAYPYVGKAVITEIMVNPSSGQYQYVIVQNKGTSTLSFYDPLDPLMTPWRISGLNFTFPTSDTLAPGQSAFICSSNITAQEFNTAMASKLSGYTNPKTYCSWLGTLSLNGDTLRIQSTLFSNGSVIRVPEDVVSYNSTANQGVALVRLSINSYGDEPANWVHTDTQSTSCSSASSCPVVDNCTIASCDNDSKCVYTMSTTPPICAAPVPTTPTPTPGVTPTPSSTSSQGTTTVGVANLVVSAFLVFGVVFANYLL